MGKHRGGDVPKALRFADRALNLYEEGLGKFPASFDLAYNKARLDLEIATHPAFVRELDGTSNSLQKALASHQYAIRLDANNADLLFNTAQVLTALAEQTAQAGRTDLSAVSLLNEALECQNRCLAIQESKFNESQELQRNASSRNHAGSESEDDEDGGASLIGSDVQRSREEDEQWVTVIEPVTINTLLDTILAKVGTLTTLCSVLCQDSSAEVPLAAIKKLVDECVSQALPKLLHAPQITEEDLQNRAVEIALARANLSSNFLDLGFQRDQLDIDTYRRMLEEIFDAAEEYILSFELLIAQARAIITLNSSVSDRSTAGQSQPAMRWNLLSRAQKALTTAASLPACKEDTASLATTHMLRGDISLLLLALAAPQTAYEQAQKNATQLLTNAEVFYRNATKLSSSVRAYKANSSIVG